MKQQQHFLIFTSPFIAGEFGVVYRARLTRSILRKTECEIVAVKTIKGKDMMSHDVIIIAIYLAIAMLLQISHLTYLYRQKPYPLCHVSYLHTNCYTWSKGREGVYGHCVAPLSHPVHFHSWGRCTMTNMHKN